MLDINHPLYQEDLSNTLLHIETANLAGKSILITGARGLIGSYLVDALARFNQESTEDRRIQIYAMGRNLMVMEKRFQYLQNPSWLHLIQHDVTHPQPTATPYDVIFHAASNTHPVQYAGDPVGTITTNVLGTYHLLEHIARTGSQTQFVLLSTVEIYGENFGNTECFAENNSGFIDCNTLRAGYPESKRVSEALCNAYAKQYGIRFVIPRICRIYGPTMGKEDSKAHAQFIYKALAGEDIVLKSDGKQLFSLLYVADCVNALLTILAKGQSGEAYNIADRSSDITLRALAEFAASWAGKQVVFELPSAAEAAGYSKASLALLDASKLAQLGWHAKHSILSGIERSLDILMNAEQ